LIVALGRIHDVLVVVGPRLVVVVEARQTRVVEDVEEFARSAVQSQPQSAVVDTPSALVLLLVLVQRRVAGPRLRLDVVPPHVFGAAAVRPQVLAGNAARVTTDALVQVEHH
jgi:hypothetical protein